MNTSAGPLRPRRLGLLAATLALLTALLTACGDSGPRDLLADIRAGHVMLGTKYDQPGLGLQNPGGAITGFDAAVSVFVVNTLADQLGVARPQISWKETPSAQRETFLRNGEVDTIAASYSITADRMKKVDFAGPYFITYQGLLVRADDDGLNSLTDLADGKKLCSVAGSTPAQNVKAQLPGVQLQEYDSYSSCVEALRRGKVDATTTDEVILAGYANRWQGEFKLVSMTYPRDTCVKGTWKTAGEPFSTEYYGIGMAQDFPEAVERVNQALQLMMSTPPGGGQSVWERDLREALGDTTVDDMIARADAPGSQFRFVPTPGDLSFLDAPSTPCPEGAE
ncbi:glutamate ABC transporter substrate-binding protein [Gordonia hirsuta DSM 44140 = NBRC 16056]|uniref:Glutamate ABC transporter substrate-binding protein n=1 Tax=Gordonia hirsuta DSM 44140 = NBRC 16056 TaxID=1121927 RepID=L7LBQ6_9ACTN|nr:glutamate ABC transporter substrate-binding protein [Gordonia hirsuta]GAC58555.1 glutamate ABC transporter substrate-binding protein [Gordonia hirsuta DSM 44140 = NBRC 16056]